MTGLEILIILAVLIAVGCGIVRLCERAPGVGHMPRLRLQAPARRTREPEPIEALPEEGEELAPLEIPPSMPALGPRPHAPSVLGGHGSGWSPPGRLTRRVRRRPRQRPMPELEGE